LAELGGVARTVGAAAGLIVSDGVSVAPALYSVTIDEFGDLVA
jgi:hypothetical protein